MSFIPHGCSRLAWLQPIIASIDHGQRAGLRLGGAAHGHVGVAGSCRASPGGGSHRPFDSARRAEVRHAHTACVERRGYDAAVTAPSLRTPPRRWHRALWLAAGGLALAIGIVGIFVPLLPTTPLVLLAAWCFSRGSARCERWLLEHPYFGPMVRDWRTHRAIPLRAKQLATVTMTIGSAWAAWLLPWPWAWLPALCCALVAVWLWRLPTRAAVPAAER